MRELSQQEVLDIVTGIGERILRYGGEANRAEDTVRRIGAAYGIDKTHVFAIASSIIITLEEKGNSVTQTRRINKVTTDLDKVDKLNDLSRNVCENTPDYDTVMEKIDRIDSSPVYPEWVMCIADGVVGGAFAVFFGGGWQELLVGFLVGALIYFVVKTSSALSAPPFFTNAAGGAATVIFIKLFSLVFTTLNISAVTIGVLMNLVPGVLLTNCIRDFVATDYTAGTAKIMETLLVAAAIALGVGVSVLWR